MPFLSALNAEVESIAKMFSIGSDQAFVVWFARVAMDLNDDDAFDALSVEGSNEKGMDLFWVDDHSRRVLIAQCKYSHRGTHRPKVKDLTNFLSCTDWLITSEALQREGRMELVAAANDYQTAVAQDYVVQLWFVYCGRRDENIDKRIRVYNDNPENEEHGRRAIHCHVDLLESLFEESRGQRPRVTEASVKVDTKGVEMSGTFGRGLITTMVASELVSLYEEHGDQLFARNVRGWLGTRKGSVNAAMISTIEDEVDRKNFWAYNNGITIVCDDYKYKSGVLRLSNFSIVNGCQTTVALARSSNSSNLDEISLLARIICPPESIVDSVILFTNSQNLVRRWELVSQDPTQRRLKREFEGLDTPVFYVIRKGDWNALSTVEKREFRSPDQKFRKIRHDLLAQYLASYKGNAVVAYKNKAFLFDRFYEQTFPPDLRVEEALFIWRAGERVQELIREEIRQEGAELDEGNRRREKYVLMLRRGGRFYALGVFGLIARLRNGPDYLRSICEERITSAGATGRIDKYAKLSISMYKQVVDDLLKLTGTDLSVLIRETDFFERVAERIANTYEVMSVNEEWLQGALPKLF